MAAGRLSSSCSYVLQLKLQGVLRHVFLLVDGSLSIRFWLCSSDAPTNSGVIFCKVGSLVKRSRGGKFDMSLTLRSFLLGMWILSSPVAGQPFLHEEVLSICMSTPSISVDSQVVRIQAGLFLQTLLIPQSGSTNNVDGTRLQAVLDLKCSAMEACSY